MKWDAPKEKARSRECQVKKCRSRGYTFCSECGIPICKNHMRKYWNVWVGDKPVCPDCLKYVREKSMRIAENMNRDESEPTKKTTRCLSWAPFSKGSCVICGKNIGGLISVKVTPWAGGYWECTNSSCRTLVCRTCESELKVGLFLQRMCPKCGHKMKRIGRWNIL